MDLTSRSNFLLLPIVAFLLSACGGGGDDSGPTVPPNNAPTSSAGADQSVDELSAVTLSGSGTDADNDTLTFAWTQTAGPAVTLTNANAASATFDAPDVLATQGTVVLTFQLAVSDGTATTNDSIDVTANDVGLGANSAPTSDAGADQSVNELSAVSLVGTGSDADNDALTYAWTQTSGPNVVLTNANMASASFTAPDVLATATPVILVFQLAVSDGTDTSNDTISVTVNDVGLGANSAPLADAGADQNVTELTTVTLDGSASSDPDGTALTYSWAQTVGTVVTLSNAAAAQPTFTAPDVQAAMPQTLTFELTVSDGTDNDTDIVDIVVSESSGPVTVSGIVSYEFVNPAAFCRGLDFNNIDVRPIRAATVQLLNSGGAVLDTMVLGDDGSYSFANVDGNQDVRLRVRAELQRAGSPSWDVELRDNVEPSGTTPLLSRPLYATDFALFNTGSSDITDANFTATTGWDGAAYTGDRAAATFAIIDAIYSGMQLVLTASPNANFSPLDAFWSVNNTLTSPSDIDAGELSSSFYTNSTLFLLGDAGTDTEEFDDHVTVHEWGHYFEDNFSRSDSIGGPHSIGGTIDPRLAFGEGWATALAAMALDNPQYCDTGAVGTTGGFGIDTENEDSGPQGYYNEMSVATLIYDLWDTDVDGTDTSSIGFDPIFTVMSGPQRTTEAFTTLFSFATELRADLNGADLSFADTQFARENLDLVGLDIYGATQTTVPAGARDVLPIYTDLPVDGTVVNICTNSDFDSGRGGNKLSEHRFLRFTTTAVSSTYNVSVTANPVPPATTDTAPTPPAMFCDQDEICDRSDPDVFIRLDGTLVAVGGSGDADSETFVTQSLPADDYVMALQEFRYSDDDASSDFPEQVCFDVSISP